MASRTLLICRPPGATVRGDVEGGECAASQPTTFEVQVFQREVFRPGLKPWHAGGPDQGERMRARVSATEPAGHRRRVRPSRRRSRLRACEQAADEQAPVVTDEEVGPLEVDGMADL